MNLEKLGRYEITREIGRGGMATVYQAIDPTFARDVAIKVLPLQLSHDPDFVARFNREARTIATLEHPSILPVYDFGEQDGRVYLVMRLLSGGNLDERLKKTGPLSLNEVVKILSPIASAMDYANAKGVLHRDVKPSNIGFDSAGNSFLMDFGIAQMTDRSNRLTATGAIVGTPAYMAPEVIRGDIEIGSASDRYSLGIVAYEALSGRTPYTGETPYQVISAQLTEQIPPITSFRRDLPVEAEVVLSKVLAKDPSDRYPLAVAFIEALVVVAKEHRSSSVVLTALEPTDTATIAPNTMSVAPITTEIPSYPGRTLSDRIAELRDQLTGRMTSLFRRRSTGAPDLPTDNTVEFDTPAIGETTVSIPDPSLPLTPPPPHPTTSPSLVLQPHVLNLLAPVSKYTIRELLTDQEPERIVNYAVTYGSGRFIVTGYGSFGGTSLSREISQSIQRELLPSITANEKGILAVQLIYNDSSVENLPAFQANIQRLTSEDINLGDFTFGDAASGEPASHSMLQLMDVLDNLIRGVRDNAPLRGRIDQELKGQPPPVRLILIIDKVTRINTLSKFLAHPLISRKWTTLIVVVEQEHFNRWPQEFRRDLRTHSKFQVWSVPSLWESEYKLVEMTVGLLFSRFKMDSPEASDKLKAFEKHIAYLGRGQIGTTLYELRKIDYWHFNKTTKQAFIDFDELDEELVNTHAWIQDLLEANWNNILGTSFPGQKRTDRAKQGVYSLMDWIIDSATFTLEEIMAEAEKRPILISSYERLRNDVVVKLLDVMVGNSYLNRVKNEFDVVWGRDVTEESANVIARTVYADQIDILQQRLEALMDDYESASEQLNRALSDVDRQRLMRQIDDLEKQIGEIQSKLDSLQTKSG